MYAINIFFFWQFIPHFGTATNTVRQFLGVAPWRAQWSTVAAQLPSSEKVARGLKALASTWGTLHLFHLSSRLKTYVYIYTHVLYT